MSTHLSDTGSLARTIQSAMLAAVMAVMCGGALHAQSVADLARQERGRKAQSKGARVYSNEDVSRMPAPTNVPAAAAEGEAKPEGGEAKPEAAAEARPAGEKAAPEAGAKPEAKPAEKSLADIEKEYRERFAKLRDSLATQESKLDVMQRELNLMQNQYYSDPNTALREQTFRTQINERTQAIDQQKTAVAKAKGEIEALEEELRKNRLPPGWAR